MMISEVFSYASEFTDVGGIIISDSPFLMIIDLEG